MSPPRLPPRSPLFSLALALAFCGGCRGGSSSGASMDEFPTSDSDLLTCTMAPPTWRGNDIDAVISCSAKVDVELGNVETTVADATSKGTTLAHTVLAREDAKVLRGKSKEFHAHLSHGAIAASHRREVRLEATVRPDFDGKGDLGAFLDKLTADRAAHPAKYRVLVSRLSP